jgi:hypothetical protein
MGTVFMVCAIVGGTLIVCQFLLTLVGLGGDQDADHGGGDHGGGAEHAGAHDAGHHEHGGTDHGSAWFFSMLTLRTLSAAAAFFGLTGLAAHRAGFEDVPTMALACGAGVAAFFLVGWLMRFMHKLNMDGTARIDRAVGCRGSVYLSIPGAKAGVGKVHVSLFNRTLEYQAVTAQQDLPTGAPIVVVSVIGPDTVEVAAATPSERNPHG